MTYLRMRTNHEPIAFHPYLSREQFNNTKDGSNICAVTKLEVMQYVPSFTFVSPSFVFNIFHSFIIQYDLDIADPSSMQDACQI